MRWWVALAFVGGCGNEAKPTPASQSAAPAAKLPAPSSPSVGWQSTSDGFVPDNSDVAAFRHQQEDDPVDDTVVEASIRIRYGKETRELTAAELVKLPGTGAGGGREERTLAAVAAWAFPDRGWRTLTLVDIKGGRTVVKRADVEAGSSTMRVRLNRRGALRVMVPDDVGPSSAPTERGGGGRGVSRRLRSAVSDIELE